MYSYIVSDLLGVASGVCGNIDTDRVGVFGHSMVPQRTFFLIHDSRVDTGP